MENLNLDEPDYKEMETENAKDIAVLYKLFIILVFFNLILIIALIICNN